MSKCPECECEDITVADGEPNMCNECGHEYEDAEEEKSPGKYDNIVVGRILECEENKKLFKLAVDVGGDEVVQIVSNAKHLDVGRLVVVAKVGAVLGDQDDDDAVVKAKAVGGIRSEGMLCNAPMLGWVGGDAGAAAKVPEDYSPGDAPPEKRPIIRLAAWTTQLKGPSSAARFDSRPDSVAQRETRVTPT
eukprot:gene18403-5894_t